jgi:hypothetical protein
MSQRKRINPLYTPVVKLQISVITGEFMSNPANGFQYLEWDKIDWSNPQTKISKYFTVKEALYLPSWKIMHIPSSAEKFNIVELAKKMDMVRDHIGTGITVSVWIRPNKVNAPGTEHHGKDYNAFVKGVPKSAHIEGKAVDWVSGSRSCDKLREIVLPKLEEFGLRMEKLPGSNWVHIDDRAPASGVRYFKP